MRLGCLLAVALLFGSQLGIAAPGAHADDEPSATEKTYSLRLALMVVRNYRCTPEIVWQEQRTVRIGDRFTTSATVPHVETPAVEPLALSSRLLELHLPGLESQRPLEPRVEPREEIGGEHAFEVEVKTLRHPAAPGAVVNGWYVIQGPHGRVFGGRVRYREAPGEALWLVGSLATRLDDAGPLTIDEWQAAFARGVEQWAAMVDEALPESKWKAARVAESDARTIDAVVGPHGRGPTPVSWILCSPRLARPLARLAPWFENQGAYYRDHLERLAALRLLCGDEASSVDDHFGPTPPRHVEWIEFWTRLAVCWEGDLRARAVEKIRDFGTRIWAGDEEIPLGYLRRVVTLRCAVAVGALPEPAWLARLEEENRANARRPYLYMALGWAALLLLLGIVIVRARHRTVPWILLLLAGLVVASLRWRVGGMPMHIEIPGLVLAAAAAFALARRAGIKPVAAWFIGGACVLSMASLLDTPATEALSVAATLLVGLGIACLLPLCWGSRLDPGPPAWPRSQDRVLAGLCLFAVPVGILRFSDEPVWFVPAWLFLAWTALALVRAALTHVRLRPLTESQDAQTGDPHPVGDGLWVEAAEPTPQTMEHWILELRSGEPSRCETAVTQLAAMGEEALPHLEALLDDDDPDVRVDVRKAIRRIREGEPGSETGGCSDA